MVCMTLSHRLNQTRGDLHSRDLAEKFYLYWGLTVRSLNDHLDVLKNGQPDDMVMAGVLMLLLTDVQQGTSLNWRCHLDGIHRLIALRGGYHTMADYKPLEPLLLVLWSVSVIGNTTCPVSDLSMTGLHFNALDLLVKQFSAAASPIQLCPLPLFAEITRINHLRSRATGGDDEILQAEAYEILGRIRAFSPEEWAESKIWSMKDWRLVGSAYKSAVELYCILSLQSLSVLPETPVLRRSNAAHGKILQELVDQALRSPKIRRSMVWPLVILGVQAVHGTASTRAFVLKQLPELSRSLGTYVPLTALRVLKAFWGSGETRWDACFDRAYAFTAQLAVDTSRILAVPENS
ncbi:related to C6 finger domain protein [Cephalotrichum gorgonifer]|uniref:Related to C6 finger domain protein n=1 Tax=Cephalotrichum gorgonifer TaxID=2041049 RepID=A0AAE8SVE7_9PEZI|nr:related to C6 finger domain protein [Cephalotrichum gorgonifer]